MDPAYEYLEARDIAKTCRVRACGFKVLEVSRLMQKQEWRMIPLERDRFKLRSAS